MGKGLLMFVVGMLAGGIVLGACLWLGRTKVASFLATGYEYEQRPVVLLKDIQLYQNGNQVGLIKAGTQIHFVGSDKTSPIENYSITLGWENRGADRAKLIKDASTGKGIFTEIRSE